VTLPEDAASLGGETSGDGVARISGLPADGWSVQGVPPGRWTLVATRDTTSQEIRQAIEVADDPTLSEVEIDLDFRGTEGDFTPSPRSQR
jgi:hypothetical protein